MAAHTDDQRRHYPGLTAGYEPRVHIAEVLRSARVSPAMVRVTLGGSDLHDYPTTGVGDELVRVFFPDNPSAPVRVPFLVGRGWEYSSGDEPSEMRTYTIRHHRRGEVDVDFVLHAGGVAAQWAEHARPGQRIAITPPTRIYERPPAARRQLLIADEPALPAALRIAELTAELVDTTLLLEVRNSECELPAITTAPVTYRWLRGSGNGVGPSGLPTAVLEMPITQDTYVWAAGEAGVTRRVRTHLRKGLGLDRGNYACIGYWVDQKEAWLAKYERLAPDERIEILEKMYEGDPERFQDELAALYDSLGL